MKLIKTSRVSNRVKLYTPSPRMCIRDKYMIRLVVITFTRCKHLILKFRKLTPRSYPSATSPETASPKTSRRIGIILHCDILDLKRSCNFARAITLERRHGRFSGKRHGHKEEHYARHIMPPRNRPIEGIAPIDARSSDRGSDARW